MFAKYVSEIFFELYLEGVSKSKIRSKGPASKRDFASYLFNLRCSARRESMKKRSIHGSM